MDLSFKVQPQQGKTKKLFETLFCLFRCYHDQNTWVFYYHAGIGTTMRLNMLNNTLCLYSINNWYMFMHLESNVQFKAI